MNESSKRSLLAAQLTTVKIFVSEALAELDEAKLSRVLFHVSMAQASMSKAIELSNDLFKGEKDESNT